MSNKKEFDFFVNQLLDHAVNEFRATEEGRLLREKLDQMDRDCEDMLMPSERDFTAKCFELLTDTNGQEETYVYRKGLTDIVQILKWLGVLA